MGKTKLIVYMEKSILSSIEKEAISEGRSKSEIAADLIGSALGSRSGSGGGGTQEIDTDKIREAFSETIREVLPREGSGVSQEALRLLIEKVSQTENLLRQISLFLSPGDFKKHAERVRISEQTSERILKKLKLDAIEDVDRIEMKVLTKEETDQMLKEMGIGVEGSK